MMVRSRAKYSFIEDTRIRVGLIAVIGVLLIWFGAPWIRDAAGRILVSSSLYREYAAVPHDVLAAELRSTKDQLNQVHYQAVLYAALQEKYVALQKESKMRPDSAYLTARVAATPPRTAYDTLLITVGEADGVVVGDVATELDIVLGSVTSVSAHSAIVTLYTSPGSEHDFKLGTPTSIVVAKGQGGGAFEASVPGTVILKAGDPVTDASSGLVVATVADVNKQITDTASQIKMYSPVTPASLTLISLMHRGQ